MKLPPWKTLLTLTLCLLLAGAADAQGRGGKKRGGRGGGGKRGKKSNKKAQQSKKAQKAAEQRAKQQLQKKVQALKAWNKEEKARALARKTALEARTKSTPTEMGPVFRSHCASCHVMPDPSFEADRVWLSSLSTTQCRDLTPDLRDGLLKYLSETTEFRPIPVTAFAEPGPGQASISAGIEGELFLRSETGTTFRLVWGPGQAGEKRVVAPGKYTLYGYRLSRGAWTLSSSGGDTTITVRADQDLPLKVHPNVSLELRAASSLGPAKPNAAGLELTMRDVHGRPLSIYRGGRRLAIPFQVETKAGASSHGVLTYTSEGRAAASLEVPLGQPSWGRVDLPFDFPFPLQGSPRVPLPAPR